MSEAPRIGTSFVTCPKCRGRSREDAKCHERGYCGHCGGKGQVLSFAIHDRYIKPTDLGRAGEE